MSVVGKYRYLMDSAVKRGHLPVIVDIFLVGRTKIITLHSSIWVSGAPCSNACAEPLLMSMYRLQAHLDIAYTASLPLPLQLDVFWGCWCHRRLLKSGQLMMSCNCRRPT